MASGQTYAGVEELLAASRDGVVRLSPADAIDAAAAGAQIVDIRPSWQRVEDGEIPGSLVIERNHLEWRLDPHSDARAEQAINGQHWIVVCTEGYASSLAAASLNSIGVPATDIAGGIRAWRAAGLPVTDGPTPVGETVPGRCSPS